VLGYSDTGLPGSLVVPGQSQDYWYNSGVLGYCDTGDPEIDYSLDDPMTAVYPRQYSDITLTFRDAQNNIKEWLRQSLVNPYIP